MDVKILDEDFRLVLIIDIYESLIWNERYNGAGDFELYLAADKNVISSIRQDYYAAIDDSDQIMIIEDIEVSSDIEKGLKVKYSGRSLESLLYRRIIWDQTTIKGPLQSGIKKILDENVISPSNSKRAIPGFVFLESTDEYITGLRVSAQYTGDVIYEVIEKLCEAFGLGFRVRLNDNYQFVFSLYRGKDRSYAQSDNPVVVFSPSYENVISTNYLNSIKNYKNVTLVAGEDSGSSRRSRTVGTAEGILRRELYTDARDIQSETEGGEPITNDEYNDLLDQRGKEKLEENVIVQAFDGQIDTNLIFVYKKDFFKGDIVQILDSFGITFTVRIEEIVRSIDENGYELYPTFTVLDNVGGRS